MSWRNLFASLGSLLLTAGLLAWATGGSVEAWASGLLKLAAGCVVLNWLVGWFHVGRHWVGLRFREQISVYDPTETDVDQIDMEKVRARAVEVRKRLGLGGVKIMSRAEGMDNMRKATNSKPPPS